MSAVLLLLLQAAAASPPERIDLLQPVGVGGCKRPAGQEIVVCGGGADRYRLPHLVPHAEPSLVPKAEARLFGGKAVGAVEAEAAQMPNGTQSNRAMARIKLPL